jgi:hypothetical protein
VFPFLYGLKIQNTLDDENEFILFLKALILPFFGLGAFRQQP